MSGAASGRWERIATLFGAALERPEAERAGFLAAECGADDALLRELQALLASHGEAEALLGESVSGYAAPMLADGGGAEDGDQDGALESGRRIGAYRILRELGRGGMGTVYLAERADDQYRRQVALKLVKRGMDTDEVLRRFRYERQILAALEHPLIARLYDGGATDDGRPYLVMEYIEGRPIDRYADEQRLPLERRLDLFRLVCQAVQYAHQNLVVHRDIKPSNILVVESGEVKLLDFGIAKMLEAPTGDAPAPPETRTGLRIMTPEHAAPEQVRGGPITTATDVYALGVLLYQLLTGRRPFEVAGRSPAELEDAVLRREPAPPSAAVMGPELRRRLRGDLDVITLKALEKDPARRYQSAQQVLDDLERHRTGHPVEARPTTLSYRLRRYAHRHRTGLIAGLVVAVALAGLAGFHNLRITGERDRAQAEAAKSRATTQFLTQLLGDAYPSVALGDSFSMTDLLARATARADSLAGQPEVQAELLRTLGDVYREQGRFGQALPLMERAVAIHRSGSPRSREAGHAMSALGHLHHQMGNFEAAVEAHREELEIFSELVAPEDSLVLYATNNLAASLVQLGGRNEEALALYQQVLDRRVRFFSDSSALAVTTLNNQAQLHHLMGNHSEAEPGFRRVLAIRRAVLSPNHPSIALTLNNLASLYSDMGRLEQAESLLREALAIWERVFGPDHPRVGLAAYNLGGVLRKAKRYAEAESLYRRTLAIDRKTYGNDHHEIGVDLHGLGRLLSESGDCERAASAFKEAIAIFDRNEFPQEDRRQIQARSALGACLTVLARFPEAEPLVLESYHAADGLEPADSALARTTLERVIGLYQAWGRSSEAASYQAVLADAGRGGGADTRPR